MNLRQVEKYRRLCYYGGRKHTKVRENLEIITEEKNEKHQEDLQRIKSFRLMDDDFMTLCFEGNTECLDLILQIVLDKSDIKVIDVHTQVFVENILRRSVQFDIMAADNMGARYNIEIQRADKGAGRKRARYNSSMLDARLLRKSEDFDTLPETYVIFITENDVMHEGQPLYQIERCVLNTGKIFGDGSHILYVNGAYRDETPIGRLMHDFSCTNPSDMHYEVLAERVRFFKESKEGVAIMCKVMEDMRDETLKEGIKEGIKEGMKTTALRMLAAGKYTPEEISGISGLSIDELRVLRVNS